MAGAVLMFRSTIGSDALKLFADIESEHGREVMGMHYNKIARLVQTCSEASKVVGIAASELVDISLGGDAPEERPCKCFGAIAGQ